ncbi:response regulator [Candidatus Jorgensenbacteria bacterium]|nr:response regulator [Candidatus Jorgensenbacteria bacterium]
MHNPPLILIADDDTQLVELFNTKLTKSGFSVRTVYNGKDACETALRDQPDLILLDLKMPVMDGVEALHILRSNPQTKNIKVLILSSFNEWSTMKIDAEVIRSIGAEDFLPKGMDVDELVLHIRKTLGLPLTQS